MGNGYSKRWPDRNSLSSSRVVLQGTVVDMLGSAADSTTLHKTLMLARLNSHDLICRDDILSHGSSYRYGTGWRALVITAS